MTKQVIDKPRILIVDDIENNRLILEKILFGQYEIEHAANGVQALNKLYTYKKKPNLILLDIVMPVMDGYDVLAMIKKNYSLSKIPVIIITAEDNEVKGLKAGAVDYISKPFEPEIIRLRISNQLELSLYRENLEMIVEEKVEQITNMKESFLETMADLIEYRSMESGEHVTRTREMSRLLINQMIASNIYTNDLQSCDYQALIKAVPLHDIGKIAISDNILLKKGKLTPVEFEIIKTHTVVGGEILKAMIKKNGEDAYMRHCYNICRYHHERWDGNGYPDGLLGIDIPLSARIVSVIDVYDALVSERCYKKAYSHEEALNIIAESAFRHFDPLICKALFEISDEFKQYIHPLHTTTVGM